ncbi:MAG: DNA mismatch repair protein MutS [Alphaproteobacteria bacterium]
MSAKGRRARSTPDLSGASPVMAQFLEIKRAHPGCLLFFRMGDFYELFFDDAVAAATDLDIALTRRGKHEGRDIPMCGVPVHSHESYLERLIRKGHRVAICEQVEDPAEAKKRGPKAIVKREVVRVITPGTITEESLLDARRPNYLAALARAEVGFAIAWLDISTGDFRVTPVARANLAAELARLGAGEILVSERLVQESDLFELLAEWKGALNAQSPALFESQAGGRKLQEVYKLATLEGLGDFGRAELGACGALVAYVELTQKGRLPHIARPKRLEPGATMSIDGATRRNLEFTERLSGGRAGSLLSVIDRSVTGAGGRLLVDRLSAPLTDPAAINRRLDAVEFFVERRSLTEKLRGVLKRIPDIARALARLTLGRGGPRDLALIRDGLEALPDLRERVTGASERGLADLPSGLEAVVKNFGHHAALVDRLKDALVPAPPLLAREGGFIAKGHLPRLDELRRLRDESRRLILDLEARCKAETGIGALKVRHNNVLGYYVEVPAAHAEKMAEPFIHRQTLASVVRYSSVELGALEAKIAHAADQALALEQTLFDQLVAEVAARSEDIARAAKAVAELDLAGALATLALDSDYTRPIVDASTAFEATGARHPVVEAIGALETGAAAAGAVKTGAVKTGAGPQPFVPNDCDLGPDQRLWLVTGPNMAGKSTFLRQNALIAVLAQMGSYVPAKSAHIGVVDRLFSRVGAADDLARGRSTFMVEMIETAAILNQASPRSLVILDEIGRGTATFDGLSIAWASVEHLHEVNRCRALFATHFHELTALKEKLDALACYTMRVKEWKGEVVFLHEVAPGAADRSYGIHVAKLAGLPTPVIQRAEEVLKTIEAGESGGAIAKLADDLPLFSAVTSPAANVPSALDQALIELNPDELTPKQALELIYRLKALLPEEG